MVGLASRCNSKKLGAGPLTPLSWASQVGVCRMVHVEQRSGKRLLLLASLALFVGLGLWLRLGSVPPAQAADYRILFVGNSYTFYHDLERIEEQLLLAGVPVWKQIMSMRQAPGGYRWEQHGADANGTNGNTQLREWLVTNPDPAFQWNTVVLQEQSQIPGFSQNNRYWQSSLNGLKVLHQLIQKKGAKTLLMMTWGRRAGDAQNQQLYKDFLTMQARLSAGYRAYAKAVGTPQAPVYIAPAGLAFKQIYDEETKAGKNPLDPSSLFSKLYESDGSHPAIYGSYLAGCVIFATITGRDPTVLSWVPNQAISATERTRLQQAAKAVVLGRPFAEDAFPWALDWDQYTGPKSSDVPNVPTGHKVISSPVIRYLVRVNKALSPAPGLVLGTSHSAPAGDGEGRLWVTQGGQLVLNGPLLVGDTGKGEVSVKGGNLRADQITLAKESTAEATLVLSGGSLEVGVLRLGQGKATTSLESGKLFFETWQAPLNAKGVTLSPGLSGQNKGIAQANIEGDLQTNAQTSLLFHIKAATTPTPGKDFDQLIVEGKATLEGSLVLQFDGTPGKGSLDLIIAKSIEDKGLSLKGATFQIVSVDGGKKALRVSLAGGRAEQPLSAEPVPREPASLAEPSEEPMRQDDAGPRPEPVVAPELSVGDAGPSPQGGCCAAQAGPTPAAWVACLLLFVFALRLRKERHR